MELAGPFVLDCVGIWPRDQPTPIVPALLTASPCYRWRFPGAEYLLGLTEVKIFEPIELTARTIRGLERQHTSRRHDGFRLITIVHRRSKVMWHGFGKLRLSSAAATHSANVC
jgi:hypothetical protein